MAEVGGGVAPAAMSAGRLEAFREAWKGIGEGRTSWADRLRRPVWMEKGHKTQRIGIAPEIGTLKGMASGAGKAGGEEEWLVRAEPEDGDPEAQARVILEVMPVLAGPKEFDAVWALILHALIRLAARMEAERVRALIAESAAEDLLQPLVVALEWEMGLEPRCAVEVREVARDVQRDLRETRR